MGNEKLQERAGNMLWNSIKYGLLPSFFIGTPPLETEQQVPKANIPPAIFEQVKRDIERQKDREIQMQIQLEAKLHQQRILERLEREKREKEKEISTFDSQNHNLSVSGEDLVESDPSFQSPSTNQNESSSHDVHSTISSNSVVPTVPSSPSLSITPPTPTPLSPASISAISSDPSVVVSSLPPPINTITHPSLTASSSLNQQDKQEETISEKIENENTTKTKSNDSSPPKENNNSSKDLKEKITSDTTNTNNPPKENKKPNSDEYHSNN